MADEREEESAFWSEDQDGTVIEIPDAATAGDEEDEEDMADEEADGIGPPPGEMEDDQPLAPSFVHGEIGEPVYAVAAHPTAPLVAAGHGGDGVRVWDAHTGEELLRADACHTDSVTAVGFSADGEFLASASLDKTLRVWRIGRRATVPPTLPAGAEGDAAADAETGDAGTDAASSDVASGAGGESAAAAAAAAAPSAWSALPAAGLRSLWEVLDGKAKKKAKKAGAKGSKKAKAGKKKAAAAPSDEELVASAGPVPMVLEGPAEDIEWMTWHPTSPVLLCGSADCTAWVFLATTGACISVLAGHEGAVTAGVFDGPGKRVVTASDDGTLRVWSPRTGECKLVVRGRGWFDPGAPVVSLACHPTKPLALAGGVDGTARLVNTLTGRILATFVHQTKAAIALERVANQTAESMGRAIDAAAARMRAGDEEVTIPISSAAEEAVAVEEELGGAAAASASAGDAAAEDDAADPAQVEVTRASIEGVAFCPTEDLQLAVTAASDGTLRVWDLSTLTVRAACRQEGSIVRVAWHPAEPAVVTCASDGSVRAFDGRDGTTLSVIPAHAAMCLDMQVRVWAAPEGPGAASSGIPWGEAVVVSGGDDGRLALVELGI